MFGAFLTYLSYPCVIASRYSRVQLLQTFIVCPSLIVTDSSVKITCEITDRKAYTQGYYHGHNAVVHKRQLVDLQVRCSAMQRIKFFFLSCNVNIKVHIGVRNRETNTEFEISSFQHRNSLSAN